MTTLRRFTEENTHQFWGEGKHLRDCKQQVYALCSFVDHDDRLSPCVIARSTAEGSMLKVAPSTSTTQALHRVKRMILLLW